MTMENTNDDNPALKERHCCLLWKWVNEGLLIGKVFTSPEDAQCNYLIYDLA